MVNAVLAAEDDNFFQHGGVDYPGLTRAIVRHLISGEKAEGGSTITMQLARGIFLSPEKSYRRKLVEIFTTLRIEQELNKQEILTLYLNKMFLGQRAYGIGAAAEVYFGKTVAQLTLPEIALIAGTFRLPSRDNPVANPELARQRRAYVLRRMREKEFIKHDEYEIAEFYPVADREGLTIDVRNNWGGNIDSIVIEKLMRRAWSYWQTRDGNRYWNQQNAFRGPIVVLANERTYSDGETFAEGMKRLGLATVIGKRTSGAGMWLSDRNPLADNGIARAAEWGLMGLEGSWLIEGVGVAPDVEVDNPPNATFNGADAQLDAAIRLLDEKLAAMPMPQPPAISYPRVQR